MGHILTSYLEFDKPKALRLDILCLCISNSENLVLRCQNLLAQNIPEIIHSQAGKRYFNQ